jgi:hypothetical protein
MGIRIISVELERWTMIRLMAAPRKPVRHKGVPLSGILLEGNVDARCGIDPPPSVLTPISPPGAVPEPRGPLPIAACRGRKVGIVLHEAEDRMSGPMQATSSGPGKELLEEPAKKRRIAFVWTDVPQISDREGLQFVNPDGQRGKS